MKEAGADRDSKLSCWIRSSTVSRRNVPPLRRCCAAAIAARGAASHCCGSRRRYFTGTIAWAYGVPAHMM